MVPLTPNPGDGTETMQPSNSTHVNTTLNYVAFMVFGVDDLLLPASPNRQESN